MRFVLELDGDLSTEVLVCTLGLKDVYRITTSFYFLKT
jgi:hypothetical protein